MKGQSAIEYLMTYGWMLLVVAIVGGLLFTLFQDQEIDDQVNDFMDDDVRVIDVGVSGNGLEVIVRNEEADRVENVNLTVGNDTKKDYNVISSIEAAGEEVITLNNFTTSNDTYEYDASMDYDVGSGDSAINDSASGTLNLEAQFTN